jgi:hypothetical protein
MVYKFPDNLFSGLGRKYYTSANKELRGSEAERKLDIFLASTNAALQNAKYDWANVLVIGEHKRNPDEDRSINIWPVMRERCLEASQIVGSCQASRYVEVSCASGCSTDLAHIPPRNLISTRSQRDL